MHHLKTLQAYLDTKHTLSVWVAALQASLAADQPAAVAQFSLAFLAYSVLSTKQFEQFYWPYVKQVIDMAQAAGKVIGVMCESHMLRFAEFFEDIPKGTLFIQLEQDDVFEYRKRLPNIAFTSGMPTELLGHGTKQQCVDYAKRLIDELGPGFSLGTTKMMSYRDDAKRENLMAVCDFVREYQP
jgi:hypothetical protein